MISATCPGATLPPAGIGPPPTGRTLTLAGLLRPGDQRLARDPTAARIEGQRDQPAWGAGSAEQLAELVRLDGGLPQD